LYSFASSEAYFHLTGYVNKQSSYYCAPAAFVNFAHSHLLQSLKVTVSCVVFFHGIIGPYFSQDDM